MKECEECRNVPQQHLSDASDCCSKDKYMNFDITVLDDCIGAPRSIDSIAGFAILFVL